MAINPVNAQRALDALKDECVQDILEMSDEELLAEYLADGRTLEELRSLRRQVFSAMPPTHGEHDVRG